MDQGPIAQSGAWLAVGREIARTLECVDPLAFRRFVDLFRDERPRWFFSGQGRSGLVAEMAAMRFMHLGRHAHCVGEATAPSIRAADGLCLVSGSGNTPVTLHFARIAKDEGAAIALITREPDSALAQLADFVLHVPIEATRQFGGSLFEQTSLILLDAIVLELTRAVPDPHRMMLSRHTNLQ
jgi:6-phospho-3-hexuloisomerase